MNQGEMSDGFPFRGAERGPHGDRTIADGRTTNRGFRVRCSVAGLSLLLGALMAAPAIQAQTAPVPSAGLRPGDMVRLKIWREPDLSGEFAVDETGTVVLPRLGPTAVAGLSADSLKRFVQAGLATYLRDPSVEVTLLRRVNVLGAVRTPGLYQVDQTQTVADVLALAGGPTPDGKADRVELVRDGSSHRLRLSRDLRLFQSPIQSGDRLWVPNKSWLARNAAAFVAASLTAGAVVVTALVRD